MTQHRLIYAATLAAALLAAAVQPVDAAPALSSFEAADADGDGRITAAEHAAASTRMFETMDADRDGRVTAAEMDAAQGRITGGATGRMTANDKIKVIDGNGDGVLTAAEHANGSTRMFTALDVNVDGVIDRKEFDAGHAGLAKGSAGR